MTSRRPESAEIEFKEYRFLITDRPSDATIDRYIDELKRYGVGMVIRVCDPTYQTKPLENAGISVLDLPFDDGMGPPPEVIEQYFEVLRSRFKEDPNGCIAIHCIAGLGRAPVLVAIALIELGMKYEDAVELIRSKRRGAINAKQLNFLQKYHPKSRLKAKNRYSGCCMM